MATAFTNQRYNSHPAENPKDDDTEARQLSRMQWRRDAQNEGVTPALRQSDQALYTHLQNYQLPDWAEEHGVSIEFIRENRIYFVCWPIKANPVNDTPLMVWTDNHINVILQEVFRPPMDVWYPDEKPHLDYWVEQTSPRRKIGVFGRDPNAPVPADELGPEPADEQKKCCRMGLPVLLVMSFANCTPRMPLVTWMWKCGKNRHMKSKTDVATVSPTHTAREMGIMVAAWDNNEREAAPQKNLKLLQWYIRFAAWWKDLSPEEQAREISEEPHRVLCPSLDELRIRLYEPKLAHEAYMQVAEDIDFRVNRGRGAGNHVGSFGIKNNQIAQLHADVAAHERTIVARETTITTHEATIAARDATIHQLTNDVQRITRERDTAQGNVRGRMGLHHLMNID